MRQLDAGIRGLIKWVVELLCFFLDSRSQGYGEVSDKFIGRVQQSTRSPRFFYAGMKLVNDGGEASKRGGAVGYIVDFTFGGLSGKKRGGGVRRGGTVMMMGKKERNKRGRGEVKR